MNFFTLFAEPHHCEFNHHSLDRPTAAAPPHEHWASATYCQNKSRIHPERPHQIEGKHSESVITPMIKANSQPRFKSWLCVIELRTLTQTRLDTLTSPANRPSDVVSINLATILAYGCNATESAGNNICFPGAAKQLVSPPSISASPTIRQLTYRNNPISAEAIRPPQDSVEIPTLNTKRRSDK
ncbi:MAG: hypothetical protein P1U77_23890 [Rubripirellula sp.]|nr:hypothetical protein [Rubripirellula sp.]